MNYSRHKCREHALQCLYQIEILESASPKGIDYFLEQLDVMEEARQFTRSLIAGTLEHAPQIDALLIAIMEEWRLERLSIVVRNLLRLSVYEMKFSEETPYEVIIDEAVIMAKEFVDDVARSFVNKVLQNIHDASSSSLDLFPFPAIPES